MTLPAHFTLGLTRRQLFWTMTAGGGALFAGAMTAYKAQLGAPSNDVVAKLWEMVLQQPNGAPLNMRQFQGATLLLNFWATWCAPCIEEMPLLNDLYRKFRQHDAKNLQMLGIAVDKSESVVNFVQKLGIAFPIGVADFEALNLSRAFGNQQGGLPFTLLIDAKQNILFKKEGKLTADNIKIIKNNLSLA